MDIFCTHSQHLHSDQGRALLSLWASAGKASLLRWSWGIEFPRCCPAPVNNTLSLRTLLAFYTVVNSSISSADVSALTIKEPRLKKLCNLIKTSQVVSNGALPWTKSASLVSNLFQINYLKWELYTTPQLSPQSHSFNCVCCDLLSYAIKTSLLWSLMWAKSTVQEALTPQINRTNSFLSFDPLQISTTLMMAVSRSGVMNYGFVLLLWKNPSIQSSFNPPSHADVKWWDWNCSRSQTRIIMNNHCEGQTPNLSSAVYCLDLNLTCSSPIRGGVV